MKNRHFKIEEMVENIHGDSYKIHLALYSWDRHGTPTYRIYFIYQNNKELPISVLKGKCFRTYKEFAIIKSYDIERTLWAILEESYHEK